MAQIYKIINTINDKVYIGKTEGCFIKRFKAHCKDSVKERCEKRPLYNAMRKHGIDKFSAELVCTTVTPEQDEIEYIKKYDSYRTGYNATLGGDGKKYISIDEEQAVAYYLKQEIATVSALANKYNITVDSMRNILTSNVVHIRHDNHTISTTVTQYAKDGKLIAVFSSTNEAGRSLGKINGSHINACLRGTRKSAYGFIWK